MDAAHQLAELDDGPLGLVVGVADQLDRLGRVVASLQPLPGQPEVHGEGHEPLLGAVVEVPLDATALRFRRVHRGLPALGQLLDPLLQLHRPARPQQGPDERPVDGRQPPHHMGGDEQDDQPGDADDDAD